MLVTYRYKQIPKITFDIELEADADIKKFEEENQVEVIEVVKKSESDIKQEATDKAYKEYMQIIRYKKNLIDEYVMVSNNLSVEAENDPESFHYEYLVALSKLLENQIVFQAVKQAGYFINENDFYDRWEKE